jgi:hypothetical protein
MAATDSHRDIVDTLFALHVAVSHTLVAVQQLRTAVVVGTIPSDSFLLTCNEITKALKKADAALKQLVPAPNVLS